MLCDFAEETFAGIFLEPSAHPHPHSNVFDILEHYIVVNRPVCELLQVLVAIFAIQTILQLAFKACTATDMAGKFPRGFKNVDRWVVKHYQARDLLLVLGPSTCTFPATSWPREAIAAFSANYSPPIRAHRFF